LVGNCDGLGRRRGGRLVFEVHGVSEEAIGLDEAAWVEAGRNIDAVGVN
jgi:hypothetical protein